MTAAQRMMLAQRLRQTPKLVLVLVALAIAALIFLLVRIITGGDDDVPVSELPAVVSIEAEDDACWTVILQGQGETEDLTPQHEGCGDGQYPTGGGTGRSVTVTKVSGPGNLTVTVVANDEELGRQSTDETSQFVTLTF